MSWGSQTVTFVFTDIESSTRRWDVDGAGMSTALVAHDDVMRSTISAHRGEVFKHTGDGVCAVFRSASDAVACRARRAAARRLPVRGGAPHGGMGWMFIADPDGNSIELFGTL